MDTFNARLNQLQPAALLIVRILIGGLFVLHGIDKFRNGIGNVEVAFGDWGVPLPALTAPLTAIIEVVAGLMLLAGAATRAAAIVLGVVMLGALLFVKLEIGILGAAETDLAYISGLTTLIAFGAGPFSVDHHMGLDPGHTATS